ncbi:MAG: putative vacuolar protein sorting-associated protein 53 [Streblomastix strix]|uniref:Putative vacuolar protein sorting-associated protein 53 n=1 Tax=Streblomastix strix TaxID=222440 RepID=A0A5J4VBM5_9EUKA|nr:MAG: putative vacuolar protein sorting-associated protein 53 [Streblomastix strix]
MSAIISWDVLDNEDDENFDAVRFVNAIFPSESSLNEIEKASYAVRNKIAQLDMEMSDAVHRQSVSRTRGKDELEKAQTSITELRGKIQEIRSRSEESEQMVQNICEEISHLDLAKRNLSNTITSLKKLQMLVECNDLLQDFVVKNQYAEIPHRLSSSIALSELFKPFKIPQIIALIEQTNNVKKTLELNIFGETRRLSNLDQALTGQDIAQLRGACDCATILGDQYRDKMTQTICNDILRVYRSEYFEGGLKNDLQHVEARYAWLKRTIRSLERRQAVFPPCWSLQAHLSWEFCDQTRKDLEIMLRRQTAFGGTLNVQQLVQALLKTLEFEEDLDIYVQSLQIEVDYMNNEDILNEYDNDGSSSEEEEEDYYKANSEDKDDKLFTALAGKGKTRTKEKKSKNINQKKQGQDKSINGLQITQQDSDSKLEDQNSAIDRKTELMWKNKLDRARNIMELNNINSRNEEDKKLEKENIKQQEDEYGELGRIQSHSASDIKAKWLKEKDQRLADEKRKNVEQKRAAHKIKLAKAQAAGDASALVPPFVPQFHGIISSCFQPFLAMYVIEEDRVLQQLIRDIIDQNQTADDDKIHVLNSATELFKRIKISYGRMKILSREKPMADIAAVFMKALCVYLEGIGLKYSKNVKLLNQQSQSTQQTSQLSTIPINPYSPKAINLTDEETIFTCTIVNTATYCHETAEQLIDTISKNISPHFQETLSAQIPQDVAAKIILLGQEGLAHSSLSHIESLLSQIPIIIQRIQDPQQQSNQIIQGRVNQQEIMSLSTITESDYVQKLADQLPKVLQIPASNLYENRWKRFLSVFSGHFIDRVIQLVGEIKRCSTLGCNQLLVDIERIQTIISDLPTKLNKSSDMLYKKKVRDGLQPTRQTFFLVAMPAEDLPKAFLTHHPNGNLEQFKHILDLKQYKDRRGIIAKFEEEKQKIASRPEDKQPK